jgi:hypothetical protein
MIFLPKKIVTDSGKVPKELLAVSKLSGLFSESAISFINYRVAEKIICRSFDAVTLSN